MPSSSRFAVAIHVLTLLETEGGRPVTSDYIAASVNTNPGFIRRILAMLGRAGLVRSQLGAGGGTLLAKPASDIPLLDVFAAVESKAVLAPHRSAPSARCAVGRHIQASLRTVFGRAEGALKRELAAVTVAEVVESVGAVGAGAGGRGSAGNPRRA